MMAFCEGCGLFSVLPDVLHGAVKYQEVDGQLQRYHVACS